MPSHNANDNNKLFTKTSERNKSENQYLLKLSIDFAFTKLNWK